VKYGIAFQAHSKCNLLTRIKRFDAGVHVLVGDCQGELWTLCRLFETKYIPNLRTEISASQGYSDGQNYYSDCLKFHTTTRMTLQEIHQLGLDEITRLRSKMESIATVDGYQGRLEEYLQDLRTSSEFEPKSATALLVHYRDIIDRIYPALLNLFHLRTAPRQHLMITETPVAPASMALAAYYLAGSSDSHTPRPGIFYGNTSELSTRRTYECEALSLHDALVSLLRKLIQFFY
jgi:uncharacterized protein (DUF885 family)